MPKTWDCIVVGNGPAGLSAAINLHQRAKHVLVVYAQESLLEKAEKVDNYLGLQSVSGTQMMQQFKTHAEMLNITFQKAQVNNILQVGGKYLLNAGGEILYALSVVLACGVSKVNPLPGENELLGRGVSYCATCDGMLYKGKDIVVWGLSPDAPEEANFLHSIGCHVMYLAPKKPEKLSDAISFLSATPTAIVGNNTVTQVNLGQKVLPVQGVFILRNAIPTNVLLPGLTLTEDNFVQTDTHMQTNFQGLFAAGDMTGKPLQVAKAVGDGLKAGLFCAEYLDALR